MQAVEGSLIQTLDKDKRWKQFFFFFNYARIHLCRATWLPRENRKDLKICRTVAWRSISLFTDKKRANRKRRAGYSRVSRANVTRGAKSSIFNGEKPDGDNGKRKRKLRRERNYEFTETSDKLPTSVNKPVKLTRVVR